MTDPPHGGVPAEVPADAIPGLVGAGGGSPSGAGRGRRARSGAEQPVPEAPVGRVLVDSPLAHLDRLFDYTIPATMAEAARPGVRVKVRFAGKDVDGFLLERADGTDHAGRLFPLRRVVSPEPVLSPAVAALAEAVAARYAGTRSDVLRLAVPPRHATVEREPSEPPPDRGGGRPAAAERAWAGYPHAAGYLRRLGEGGSPRAVLSVTPGDDWPLLLASAAAAADAAGRGALLCLPDTRDVARVGAALTTVLGSGHHVALTARVGPARRYRDFLTVSRGTRRIVVGTRAAAFAPVHDLGLVVVWDDGDDLHAEPRAPYPHTREILLLRAEQEGTAALVAGFARTVEAEYLLRTGWAAELAASRARVRAAVTVHVAGGTDLALRRDPHGAAARVPREVHDLIRTGLQHGPVLVQTPRRGYVPVLACDRCRTPARCAACTGPVALAAATAPPACRWCGLAIPDWRCAECGGRGLRAPVVGEERTAEELGRALAPARVVMSAGDRVLAEVDGRPAVVVATPGAEPVADGGYPAVVLLDTWLPLGRADLRAAEEALRRWSNAAGLVRPGGRVMAVGDPGAAPLQALVRWDHAGFAERETADRRAARLPPAARLATLTGEPGAVDDALTLLERPEGMEVLGPVPVGDGVERVVLRVPRTRGPGLSAALRQLHQLRAARKLDPVRVQVDPVAL